MKEILGFGIVHVVLETLMSVDMRAHTHCSRSFCVSFFSTLSHAIALCLVFPSSPVPVSLPAFLGVKLYMKSKYTLYLSSLDPNLMGPSPLTAKSSNLADLETKLRRALKAKKDLEQQVTTIQQDASKVEETHSTALHQVCARLVVLLLACGRT